MIRINLLPVREARRRAGVRQQMMVMGGALVGALLVALVGHQMVRSEISSTRARIAQQQQQLEHFKPQQEKMETFKAKRAEIESKLAVIERLEKSRSGPVRVLDELASRIPDRLWLTEMNARNRDLELRGMSLDNELVALFLTRLANSPYFSRVELVETELKEVDSLKLNTFRIQARLETPGLEEPEAVPATAPGKGPARPNRRARASS